METKLTFKYDREGDILYINKRAPYPEQDSEELGDEVIARLNSKTGEIVGGNSRVGPRQLLDLTIEDSIKGIV